MQSDLFAPGNTDLNWKPPEWWVNVGPRQEEGIALGKSDFVLRGPFVDTFRPARRRPPDRRWIDKVLDFPVVSLFVPQPMPMPPAERGRYFAWGQREVPWSAVVDRPIPGPQNALISVSR